MAILLFFVFCVWLGSERLAQDQFVNKYVLKSRTESVSAEFRYLFCSSLCRTSMSWGGGQESGKTLLHKKDLFSRFLLNTHRLNIFLFKEPSLDHWWTGEGAMWLVRPQLPVAN